MKAALLSLTVEIPLPLEPLLLRLKMALPLSYQDVLEHPDSGVGTPVRMSGRYAGVWGRKISFDNTLYYVFNEEKVVVLSIKLSSSHFATSTETGSPAKLCV